MTARTVVTKAPERIFLTAACSDCRRQWRYATVYLQALWSEYRVESAMNGREVFEKAKESVPDLIITDIMVPDMDGHALCYQIKNDKATGHIPLIMLTAKADLESKPEGLLTGTDDDLTKPFDARELLLRKQNLIHQRKQLRTYSEKKLYFIPINQTSQTL